MTIEKFALGKFQVTSLCDGFFFLDGGAMFGVIPKVLWEKKAPANEKNRIRLSLRSLLVRTGKALVLIETGLGTKTPKKFSDNYEISLDPGLLPSLQSLGFRAEDIDFVINTHLHFDHCGGNTVEQEGSKIVPAFPKAKYVIQAGEWHDAQHPNARDRGSYLTENFMPLEKSGQLLLVKGNSEITDGVEVILTPGHTASHQSVKIISQGNVLFYLGDLVPSAAHIGLSYVMSYDLYPLETMKTKKKVYEQALAEDWTLAFVHDPVYSFGKVAQVGSKFEFRPASVD
jgi:glyoxylase-like metal-dependent hydrolase (beta-lactamase superfamily II)